MDGFQCWKWIFSFRAVCHGEAFFLSRQCQWKNSAYSARDCVNKNCSSLFKDQNVFFFSRVGTEGMNCDLLLWSVFLFFFYALSQNQSISLFKNVRRKHFRHCWNTANKNVHQTRNGICFHYFLFLFLFFLFYYSWERPKIFFRKIKSLLAYCTLSRILYIRAPNIASTDYTLKGIVQFRIRYDCWLKALKSHRVSLDLKKIFTNTGRKVPQICQLNNRQSCKRVISLDLWLL